MHKNIRKLVLNKETVRTLQASELSMVAGQGLVSVRGDSCPRMSCDGPCTDTCDSCDPGCRSRGTRCTLC
jgi:hypothetical protein